MDHCYNSATKLLCACSLRTPTNAGVVTTSVYVIRHENVWWKIKAQFAKVVIWHYRQSFTICCALFELVQAPHLCAYRQDWYIVFGKCNHRGRDEVYIMRAVFCNEQQSFRTATQLEQEQSPILQVTVCFYERHNNERNLNTFNVALYYYNMMIFTV